MGKEAELNLHQQQTHESRNGGEGSSGLSCERCSIGLSRILKKFSFRCFVVLILGLFLLVSVIFWILPHRTVKIDGFDGFDAKDSIKLSASVQVYFRLEKPVSELVPRIKRLEYDINEEIGVPNAKVAVLSMHRSGASNWTNVVFGVLSDPTNIPINQVSLSVLRSSLIDVFLGESNLTLTAPLFGRPSMFEILKFPGGITIVPVPYASIWQFRQTFFSFTLNNSIAELLDNLSELRDQLKFGLHLQSYESIVVQFTNTEGSTLDFPVIVQASVVSDLGNLLPQRLQQLAQTINNSHSENLGLNNSVFGKVKSVVLSTYLKHKLQTEPPSLSPAPSPELNHSAKSPISPALSPAPSPSGAVQSPEASPKYPRRTLPPASSPAPLIVTADPPHPCGYPGSPISQSPEPSHSNPSPPISSSPPPSHSKRSPPISSGAPSSHSNPSPPISSSPSPSHSNPSPPISSSPPPSHSNPHPPISSSPPPSHSNPHPPISSSPLPSHSNRSPYLRTAGSRPLLPPSESPLPQVSYAGKGSVSQLLPPPPSATSPSSLAVGPFYREVWWLVVFGLLIFHLLCCQH